MQRIKHCDLVPIDQEIERTLRNLRKLQAKKSENGGSPQ